MALTRKQIRERYMAKHRTEVLARRRAKGPAVREKNKEYMQKYLKEYYVTHTKTMKDRALAYYRNNKGHALEKAAEYRKENRAHVLAAVRDWQKRNPGANKKWRKKNPDRSRVLSSRRRANLANAPVNDLTTEQWVGLQALFEHRCAYCSEQRKLTQDHIVPLSKGGGHTASNIVPACQSCNSRKGAGPVIVPIKVVSPHGVTIQ